MSAAGAVSAAQAGHVLVLAQLAATLFMTGLIWYAQVVHYPLFGRVPAGAFPPYQQDNVRRTAALVIPVMFVELGAGTALLWLRPDPVPRWATISGAALLGVIWLSTALVQAPAHGRIARAFDARTHRFILATNWVRTAAWTLRSALVVHVLLAAFAPRS